MQVLVMDSKSEQRKELCDRLAKNGFSICESEGGVSALDDMSTFKKDVVVLDYETWRQNRAVYQYFEVDKLWNDVPVIVVGSKKRIGLFKNRTPMEKDEFIETPLDVEKFDKILSDLS